MHLAARQLRALDLRFVPRLREAEDLVVEKDEELVLADGAADVSARLHHRAFVRWSFINYQENDPNAFPALGYASLNTRGQNIVGALISTLRPSLINEARFSYLPNLVDLGAFMQGTDFYKQAGIPGFEDTGHRPGVASSSVVDVRPCGRICRLLRASHPQRSEPARTHRLRL